MLRIEPATIRDVERLLEEGGASYRAIARLTGVSRGTVAMVARGRRRADDALDVPSDAKPLGPPRRCPGCGGMVEMPCKLCQTRELMISKELPRCLPAVDVPIGLNLRPEHRSRYEEVRRMRREGKILGAEPRAA